MSTPSRNTISKQVLFWMAMWGLLCCTGIPGMQLCGEGLTWKNQPQKINITPTFSYVYQQDEASAITVLQLLIKGGRAAVPVSKRGLAFITTRLAMELSSPTDLRDMMQMGAMVYPSIEGDYTLITIKCLSAHLTRTLKILVNVLQNPLFSGPRVSRLSDFMEHRNKREEDAPEESMVQAYLNAFATADQYGYGGSDYGDEETRKAISKKDILDYYQRFFNDANMIIILSSDLPEPHMTSIMKKYFTSIPTGQSQPLPGVRTTVPPKKNISLIKENQQVLISLGTLTPAITKENYVRLFMLDNLLGKGIGSKLWSLRSQDDLAYSLNTRFIQLKNAGILMVYLKTDRTKKEGAIKALKKLMADFYQKGVTEEELHNTRIRSKADFLRSCETKEQRTQQMAYFEVMGLGFHFLEDFFTTVDKVTVADLTAYFRGLPDPAQWVEVTIGSESGR